ncbi:hypothetical protein D9M70_646160 [compost metagenome]
MAGFSRPEQRGPRTDEVIEQNYRAPFDFSDQRATAQSFVAAVLFYASVTY